MVPFYVEPFFALINPYSNGICSMSAKINLLCRKVEKVLILILMEYAL